MVLEQQQGAAAEARKAAEQRKVAPEPAKPKPAVTGSPQQQQERMVLEQQQGAAVGLEPPLSALTDEQKALSDASDVEATAEMTAWAAAEKALVAAQDAVAAQNAAALAPVAPVVPGAPVAPVAPAVPAVPVDWAVASLAPVTPLQPVVMPTPQPVAPVVKQPVQPVMGAEQRMEGAGGYLTRGGSEQASCPAPQQAQQSSFQPVTPYTETEPVVVGAVGPMQQEQEQEQQALPPMAPDLGWPVGQQEQRPGDGKAKDAMMA